MKHAPGELHSIPRKDEPEFSARLGILRLPLMVCVVYQHAYRPGGTGVVPRGWVTILDVLLSDGLVMLARPLFFLIAGFFFFAGGKLTRKAMLGKWRSRCSSVLVPYVLWNLLVLALWAVAQGWTVTAGYVPGAGKHVADFGTWDYANALLGLQGYPIAYQLWFLRDLMLLFLLAPLVQFATRAAPNLFLLILVSAWLWNLWPLGIPAAEGVVFFYAGVLLAVSRGGIGLLDRFALPIGVLFAGFLLAYALCPETMADPFLRQMGLIPGVLAVLCFSRPVIKLDRVKRLSLLPGGVVFFIFAAHEPLLTVVKRGVYLALGSDASTGAVLLSRLAVTALVTLMCAAGYRMLGRMAPGLLRVLVGRR